jgi:hypothetical protein
MRVLVEVPDWIERPGSSSPSGALNTKIIQVVDKRGLTHAQVASLSRDVPHARDRDDEPEHESLTIRPLAT